jgi:hypothetical protein
VKELIIKIVSYTASAPLSLPAGIKNPQIRPFMSGAFVGTVPAEIPPLSKDDETKIVRTLFNELNEKFCVNLDCQPSFERNVPPRSLCTAPAGRYSSGHPTWAKSPKPPPPKMGTWSLT